VVAQVGQYVRVEMVGDSPVIVDVVGARQAPVQSDAAATVNTTSTSYVTLGSSTPAVTLDLVAGQTVLVTISARMAHDLGAGHAAVMSYSVSGVDVQSAADADSIEENHTVGSTGQRTSLYTAASTGSHTFTGRYKQVNGGTATFVDRRILAVP
jgi:hypothetical protein